MFNSNNEYLEIQTSGGGIYRGNQIKLIMLEWILTPVSSFIIQR